TRALVYGCSWGPSMPPVIGPVRLGVGPGGGADGSAGRLAEMPTDASVDVAPERGEDDPQARLSEPASRHSAGQSGIRMGEFTSVFSADAPQTGSTAHAVTIWAPARRCSRAQIFGSAWH